MQIMPQCYLENRTCLLVSGPEARPFLQGLVTNNVDKVQPGQAVYALLLTPQGRYLHDFFMIDWQGGVLLDVAVDRADELQKRLKLYKLRRQMEIEKIVVKVAAQWDSGFGIGDSGRVPDLRYAEMGYRLYGETLALEGEQVSAEQYEVHRIALGVVDGADMTVEKSLALDFGMDDLHAIDFTKGCYVGQEVTARMHYKATPRRGIYQIESMQGEELPEKGTELLLNGEKAGEMCLHAGAKGLALVKHEMAVGSGTIRAGVWTANGVAVRLTKPCWSKPLPSQ